VTTPGLAVAASRPRCVIYRGGVDLQLNEAHCFTVESLAGLKPNGGGQMRKRDIVVGTVLLLALGAVIVWVTISIMHHAT